MHVPCEVRTEVINCIFNNFGLQKIKIFNSSSFVYVVAYGIVFFLIKMMEHNVRPHGNRTLFCMYFAVAWFLADDDIQKQLQGERTEARFTLPLSYTMNAFRPCSPEKEYIRY
jgi:hypothetical protein